jgi:hypothetical protein
VGTTFWFDLPLEHSDSDELALQAERRGYDRAREGELQALKA